MFYQVKANLFFDEHDEGVDFYHDCELAFAKAIMVNPDAENTEHSTIELILNHHDDNPNEPCEYFRRQTTEPD